MSDFLIVFDPDADPGELLTLLRLPYGETRREGWAVKFRWGAVAVLADLVAQSKNILRHEEALAAWIGDLPSADKAVPCLLTEFRQLTAGEPGLPKVARGLAGGEGVGLLNGSYGVILANARCACVVTDLMAGVQVYSAEGTDGRPRAVGSHVDLVALVGGRAGDLDPVSVGEFVSTGTPCCPHTMYRGVTELKPACVFVVSGDGLSPSQHAEPYWMPPAEVASSWSNRDIAEEFTGSWTAAVRNRCQGDGIGVQLSGGLDSRIVMAAVPREQRCVGLTYLDEMNREARIARRAAEVYSREWKPLQRDGEYVGRTAMDAIRFTGCEGEWHHAHAIGFVKNIATMGLGGVLTGLFMDNNFKGYYARDVVSVSRWHGLLPPSGRVVPLDYVHQVGPFCRKRLVPSILDALVERRRQFYQGHFACGRKSEWEWLDGHPLSQSSDNTGWAVERRLMPLRLPVYDRRMLDLAFRIPGTRKHGKRLFVECALRILGPGCRVPNANDGVLPGSGYAVRLGQRLWRRAHNRLRRGLSSLGIRTQVPHSWHDFQRYWRESRVLAELVREHGGNLARFEGTPFAANPVPVLSDKSLYWREAYRLVQLAVWLSVIADYHRDWADLRRKDRPADRGGLDRPGGFGLAGMAAARRS